MHSKASRSVAQPAWIKPVETEQTSLVLYNSLTRKKEKFIPISGRKITWYNCGPTVYDAAHIGHARLYLSVDIIRRVLQDYFNYDVQFVMNITDIDDKIILRARQQHLYAEFLSSKTISIDQIEALCLNYISRNFGDFAVENWTEYNQKATFEDDEAKAQLKLKQANNAIDAIKKYKQEKITIKEVCEASKDVISASLDAAGGASITDHSIFRNLSSYWEGEFLKDMELLGVRPPDVMTRVSEYVEEIVAFVERIIKQGYGYVSDGSVYFDTKAFHSSSKHHYAKLEPWAAHSSQAADAIADGEGALSVGQVKQNSADFALWKKSKDGEPAWPSPWGNGRPGWHIECSAMATAVLGENIDLHSGGIDLAFPHHDNEIAQSEACFDCPQWVNYWLHVGHLHVNGQKMSKSLKNFLTIRQALQTISPLTLRLLVLMQPWQSVMDFNPSGITHVLSAEVTFRNFVNTLRSRLNSENIEHQYTKAEQKLMESLQACQTMVHNALCDNIDTPAAIGHLLELVSATNIYFGNVKLNGPLLQAVGRYFTRITRIFGLTIEQEIQFGANSTEKNTDIMPYVTVLSDFRDEIRGLAKKFINKSEPEMSAALKSMLEICDRVRDVDLLGLDVQLQDTNDKALIHMLSSDDLNASNALKNAKEAEKEQIKQALEIKRLEKLYAGRIKPQESSLALETNMPKSALKKLQKTRENQEKLHQEFLQVYKTTDWTLLKQEYARQSKEFKLPDQ